MFCLLLLLLPFFLFCSVISSHFTIDTNRGRFMELYNISIYYIRLYLEYNQFPKNVYWRRQWQKRLISCCKHCYIRIRNDKIVLNQNSNHFTNRTKLYTYSCTNKKKKQTLIDWLIRLPLIMVHGDWAPLTI